MKAETQTPRNLIFGRNGLRGAFRPNWDSSRSGALWLSPENANFIRRDIAHHDKLHRAIDDNWNFTIRSTYSPNVSSCAWSLSAYVSTLSAPS